MSCSGNSSTDDSNSNTSVTVISNIFVGGNAFTFGGNSTADNSNTVTSSVTANGAVAQTKTFSLRHPNTGTSVLEAMNVSITRPSSQSSITGTYYISAADGATTNNNVSGYYQKSGFLGFYFKSGSVSVTDIGNNNYKLIFNNIVSSDDPFDSGGNVKPITGTYQGNFVVED